MMTKAQKRKYVRLVAQNALKIEAKKGQKPVSNITIEIEWSRSRTWGHNPHATARVNYKDGTYITQQGFKASGCGYDKESSVIADIFNTFLSYKLYRPMKKTHKSYYGFDGQFKMSLPYGIAIHKHKKFTGANGDIYPKSESRYFEGAIGTDCYYDIANAIGGKFEHTANLHHADCFVYTDKSKK